MRIAAALFLLFFGVLAGIGYLCRRFPPTEAEEAQAVAAERDSRILEQHRREHEIANQQRERALKQEHLREGYRRECEDKGLRFVGTLGEQVQCAPSGSETATQ